MANSVKDELDIIFEELKAHTDYEAGRPLVLTSEMYMELLNYFQNGLDREEAVRSIHLGLTTFYSYMSKSETFRKAVERAEDFPNVAAQIAIVKDLTGEPAKVMKVGNKEVLVPEKPANVDSAKWWLERVKKGKFSKSPEVVNNNNLIGAPRNATEAQRMTKLLELASKYVRPKPKSK